MNFTTIAEISNWLRSMDNKSIDERVSIAVSQGYDVQRKRVRGSRTGDVQFMTRTDEIRIMIHAPRGKFRYADVIIWSS